MIALYKKPADPEAFGAHYRATHLPLAKTLPGLRRYEISAGPVGTPAGESPLHLLAILSFDSMAASQAALTSPEGVATAADMGNSAQAGVELLMFDTRAV